jgi:Ca-activated chloride channel family protein
MRFTSLLIVVILCLAVVSTPRAQDSPSGPVISLSLIATDKDGKGLNSIRKDEIRVFENQIEQTVLGLEADERPVDYVIVMDSTGSFKQFLEDAIDAAKLFVINRRPQDEVAIVRFAGSNTIERVVEFSTDGAVLQKELDGSYVEAGQSAVIDALYLSTQYVAQHKANENRRKALVVFTDGDERISYYKLKDLIRILNQESVQMFAIGFVTDLNNQTKPRKGQPLPRERAEKLLATLAEQSGGRVFFPESKEQVVASAAEILLHLRAQFRIKYQSTSDVTKTGFRDVEVKFATAEGETRLLVTPRAYWFGPKPQPEKPDKKKKKS